MASVAESDTPARDGRVSQSRSACPQSSCLGWPRRPVLAEHRHPEAPLHPSGPRRRGVTGRHWPGPWPRSSPKADVSSRPA